MKHNFELPERMKHMKLDERGYPIPYFVPIVDGKPEFVYQDIKKKEACRKHKLCHVCGTPLLAKSFWFIQGPLGLRNQVSSDEPMHEECARFSITYCPHLITYKAKRKGTNPLPSQVMKKAVIQYLIKADKLWYPDKIHTHFRVVEFETYHYRNNKLVKVGSEEDIAADKLMIDNNDSTGHTDVN